MIRVGYEFHVDKRNLGRYGWDYVVAFTAAFFPWILVTGYFVFVMLPPEPAWVKEIWIDWWFDDPDWRSGPRDYWRVETDHGDRLWLFYAHGGALSAGWFCHGAFA